MTATRIVSVLDDVLAVAAATFIRTALPDALLILAGVVFGAMHVVPLGMACFVAATTVVERVPGRLAAAAQ